MELKELIIPGFNPIQKRKGFFFWNIAIYFCVIFLLVFWFLTKHYLVPAEKLLVLAVIENFTFNT